MMGEHLLFWGDGFVSVIAPDNYGVIINWVTSDNRVVWSDRVPRGQTRRVETRGACEYVTVGILFQDI